MDNEKKQPEGLSEEEWLEEILGIRQIVSEVTEQEIADSLDLEKIVQETLLEDWDTEPVTPEQNNGIDATQLFARQNVPAKPQEEQEEEEAAVVFTPAEGQMSIDDLPGKEESSVSNEETAKLPFFGKLSIPVAQQKEEQPEVEITDEVLLEEEPEEEVRKTRPRMKKGYGLFGLPHVAATVIWLFIIVGAGTFLGRFLWICAADLLAFGKEPINVTVTITGEDLAALKNDDPSDDKEAAKAVAIKLKEAGLIDHEWLFEFFSAQLTSKIRNISPGTFEFTDLMIYDYNAIIKVMTDYGSDKEVVEVMFPEGYTCGQIFQLLEDNGVCKVADLEAYVEKLDEHIAKEDFKNYWFLSGLEFGHKYSLEGYLYPDTYQFYKDQEPGKVLEKFLDTFEDRAEDNGLQEKWIALNERMREQMAKNGYGENDIAEHQLSFRDVVILASIVQKESANTRESYTIASVFFNRLCHPSKYPKLESDATIDYAINYYNKGELTTDELINASPYHTYTHDGLPAGPIANPGLTCLGAALNPEKTMENDVEVKYYFFILDKEKGEHVFSKTREEHNRWEEALGYK